jgi:hypothetical protein
MRIETLPDFDGKLELINLPEYLVHNVKGRKMSNPKDSNSNKYASI